MKNQYIADIGDYGKYGLLRFLLSQGIRLGVNWYFTPNDDRKDGRYLQYLDRLAYRDYDPAVYDRMKQLAFLPDKDIKMVENCGLFDDTVFYHAVLDTDSFAASDRMEARNVWHTEALQALKETSLVFADPDNGLGINRKASVKDAQRFILPEEAADYYNRGQDVLYYHHRDRKNPDGWMKQKTYMKQVLPDARLLAVAAHKWSMRAYIFVVHPGNARFYETVVERFLRSPWGTLKTNRTPFFAKEEV